MTNKENEEDEKTHSESGMTLTFRLLSTLTLSTRYVFSEHITANNASNDDTVVCFSYPPSLTLFPPGELKLGVKGMDVSPQKRKQKMYKCA